MWRRVLAYFLFALGFLTITFFRKYTGEIIPHPFIFWILGIAMFLGGYFFLNFTPTTKEVKNQKKIAAAIRDLKANGEKIQVDLTKCEIKENNYGEKVIHSGSQNDLPTHDAEQYLQERYDYGGNSRPEIEQVEVNQTVLVFSYFNEHAGKTEKFRSRVIPKDEISLSFELETQKQTTLYVDKTNRSRYFFDLDFLNG